MNGNAARQVAALLPLVATLVAGLPGCTSKAARPERARLEADGAGEREAAGRKAGEGEAGPEKVEKEDELVPLKLKLPRPAFTTCWMLRRHEPDVERHTGPRAPLMVPTGTRNVALGKPVTSSDFEPRRGRPELVTDGNREAGKLNHLVLRPGPQYVQIDFGSEHVIHGVLFWHRYDALAIFRDVVLLVAEDPDFVLGVKVLFNNDHDNSLGLGVGEDREYFELFQGRLVDAKGVVARYVRLHGAGSRADGICRFTEVEVYGRPVR